MKFEEFKFVIKISKRKAKEKEYFHNGDFSGSKGIKIFLGNIVKNNLKEEEKDKENDDLDDLERDDLMEGYLIFNILEAINHETIHQIFYKYFFKDDYKICSSMQVAFDEKISDVIDDTLEKRKLIIWN